MRQFISAYTDKAGLRETLHQIAKYSLSQGMVMYSVSVQEACVTFNGVLTTYVIQVEMVSIEIAIRRMEADKKKVDCDDIPF